MAKIPSLPIPTTDRIASESEPGRCNALLSAVPTYESISGTTSGVVSDYGVRKSINDYMDNIVDGNNLGTGEGIFSDYTYSESGKRGTINLKSVRNSNSRFTTTTSGNNIVVGYDGSYSSFVLAGSGLYVQGGNKQLWQNFGGLSGFSYWRSGTNYWNISNPPNYDTGVAVSSTNKLVDIDGNTRVYQSGGDSYVYSTEDGDMEVVYCDTLTVGSGHTITTNNRCRGLFIVANTIVNDGEVSMTARGCHANPADSEVTADTPVAPTDGNAVPASGLQFYFPTDTGSDSGSTNLEGTGTDGYDIASVIPRIEGDPLTLITIPRTGGAGAAGVTAPTNSGVTGGTGGTVTNGTGGGASGGGTDTAATSTDGTAGTCFSGGTASGGVSHAGSTPSPEYATPYGGAGGDGADDSSTYGACGGGAGNPGGAGDDGGGGSTQIAYDGGDGTGGLLIITSKTTISGSGSFTSEGVAGGNAADTSSSWAAGGGGSGGGIILIGYGTSFSGPTTSAAGGTGGVASGGPYPSRRGNGGVGGAGSVISQKLKVY